MNSLTLPIRAINWAYECPTAMLAGVYTGRASIITEPWRARWRASVELAPVGGEDEFRQIRSFLAQRKGRIVPFKIAATAEPQNENTGVTVGANADQGDTSMTISGAATALLDGQYVTVNGQLLCLTADQSGTTINFRPPLREDAAAGTPVATASPYAFVHMAESRLGYSVGLGPIFGASFEVEEAIREPGGDLEFVTFDETDRTFDDDDISWDNG